MTQHYTSSKKYIPQLDGIRGLAILLVISFHFLDFSKIFSLGWSGVDLFFVLSGYLITSRLANTNDPNYFSKFYRNRALRILPLYFLVLIIFYIVFNLFVKSENLQYFSYYNKNWWAFLLFLENWSFIKALPIANHLQHFWSLAVEEQFYLIWPLFLFIFLRKKYFFIVLFILLISIIIFRTVIYTNYPAHKDSQHFFYNTFCRMDGFIIGALLFFIQKRKNIKNLQVYFWLAFLLLLAGLFFTNTNMSNPFTSTIGLTLIAINFAGLINAVTINKNTFLIRLFSQPWITLTGKISYGLYIYHWIILRILYGKLLQLLSFQLSAGQSRIKLVSLLFCFVLSYILSLLSYFYFESYFLKMKQK